MIAYDLTCANGHSFEGWFKDLKAFEYQKSKKLIGCPVCNDTSVTVVPSTFGIKSNLPASRKPQEVAQPGNDKSELTPEKIMKYLDKNFEDVGHDFAKEALKMHYDVSEKRNIRGTSTPNEEETLEKEGIKFFKFPIPQADS